MDGFRMPEFLRGSRAKADIDTMPAVSVLPAVSSPVETATTDDDSNTMIIHLLTNPTSPRGKQHCQQLTVPGGKSSLFWQGEGWRYTNWVASA